MGYDITSLHLYMGLQCNTRCAMCYQTDFSKKSDMPQVIYKQHLSELYPHLQQVKIQGGEPTIMSNCAEFARLVRPFENIKLIIATNGVNVSEFWMEVFSRQGKRINFSVNASRTATYNSLVKYGNFDRVVKNAAALLSRRGGDGPTVSVSSVILPGNAGELSHFVEFWSDVGVDFVEFLIDPLLSFNKLPERAAMQREMEKIKELKEARGLKIVGISGFAKNFGVELESGGGHIEKPPCRVPFKNILVDYNGDVLVCANTWKVVGNTYKSSITEILESPLRQEFRRKVEKNDYMWCASWCASNPAPKKAAILHKCLTQFKKAPYLFLKRSVSKYKKLKMT
jgi:MoaA/NifB/PqqE/SkfB family radical SAM enzyme